MIDITKKYRTRDGREVRIYATDGGDLVEGQTIHGAVLNGNNWVFAIWNAETGKNYANSAARSKIDLIEVKPRITQRVWINVYPDHCLGAYHEKRQADEQAMKRQADDQAMPHRIGCVQVEIDISEGEGL